MKEINLIFKQGGISNEKFLSLIVVVSLVLGSTSVSFASTESKDEIQKFKYVEEKINKVISDVKDVKKQEKIKDVLTPLYSADVSAITDSAESDKEAGVEEIIEIIKRLSDMSNEELDIYIKKNLDKFSEMLKNNPGISVMDSGYSILSKYLPEDRVNEIKTIENNRYVERSMPIVEKKEEIASNGSTLTYNKSGKKKISNLLVPIGTLKISVKWTVQVSSSVKKITHYWKEVSATGSSTSRVVSHGIPKKYNGQRAYVKGEGVWVAGFKGTATAWFYNDGGFDIF